MEKDTSNIVLSINPTIYKFISHFFFRKKINDFSIHNLDENTIRISPISKPILTDTLYYFELSSSGCEFLFSCLNKHFYLEILNDFDNIDDYFKINKNYGNVIAKILTEKYIETYQEEISLGNDLELDEVFHVNFIDNFVNIILNNVYIE